MFGFLFKLVKGAVKKTKIVGKQLKSLVKHPVRYVSKRIKNSLRIRRRSKRDWKKVTRLRAKIKSLSPKGKAIEEINRKVNLVENMVTEENLILNKRSQYTKDTTELTKDILTNNKFLKDFSKKELSDIDKHIQNELKDLGLKDGGEIEKAINDEEFRQDIVKTNSYKDFMENWKNGFFNYTPEELGMSEDERDIVWAEIESTKTFEWYQDKKM